MAKLCAKKDSTHNRRVAIWANPKTMKSLEWIKEFYRNHLDRELSNTLIIRRAVELLGEYLKGRQTNKEFISEEVIKMIKHIR